MSAGKVLFKTKLNPNRNKNPNHMLQFNFFFLIFILGQDETESLDTAAANWPTVPALDNG
jgi:hypothetical protein